MVADIVRLSLAACAGGLAFVGAVMADEASPKAAPTGMPPLPDAPPAIVHLQVNMAGFSREYRPIPMSAPAADAAIREALRAPMRRLHDFEETPLRAVIDQFSDSSGLPIACDTPALTDAGIDLDATTVTQALTRTPGVSLAAALRCVLRDIGLTWIMRDDVLTVTTREKAQDNLVVVAYPLPRGFGASRPGDVQSMIDLIQSTVAGQTWDTVGGPAAIRPLDLGGDPLMIVSQTAEIHDEIEHLLGAIHARLRVEFAAGRPVLKVHRVADAAARQSLTQTLVGLCNKALSEAADPKAEVTVVGDSVAVVSTSPEFHALAAQVVAAVDGVVDPSPVTP